MLPKPARLNLKKDFTWLRGGEVKESDLVRLFVRQGENSAPKVGIATAAKIFKKAVERNRARRLVSTAVQNLYQDLPTSINILVMPKRSILAASSDKVTEDIKKLLT